MDKWAKKATQWIDCEGIAHDTEREAVTESLFKTMVAKGLSEECAQKAVDFMTGKERGDVIAALSILSEPRNQKLEGTKDGQD